MSSSVQNVYSDITKDSDGRIRLAAKVANNTVDFNAVIDEIVHAKEAQASVFKDEIVLNTDKKIPAIEELRTKAFTLQKCLLKLTNDLRSDNNALNAKIPNLKSTDDAVSIRPDNAADATENDHSVFVTQVAAKDKCSFGLVTATRDQVVGQQGNLSINNALIPITQSDTLSSIADKINFLSQTTHVKANLYKTSNKGDFKLILESTHVAEPINFFGTQGTDSSFFGLIPTSNTPDSALAGDGSGPIVDVVNSPFSYADHTNQLPFNGTLVINGQPITLTGGTSTLDSLIDDINNNPSTNVTASLQTITNGSTITYGLTLTGNTPGTPIDFFSSIPPTDSVLLGLVPNTITSNLASTAIDQIKSGFKQADATAAMGFSGTLSINNQLFNMTDTLSLRDTAALINGNQDAQVLATVEWNNTASAYQLVLTGKNPGSPINIFGTAGTDTSIQTTLKSPTSNTLQDTLMAKFTFDDIEMSRDTNSIKDLLYNVTITINKKSTQDTVFDIEYQKTEAYTAITQFVDAYNDVVKTLDVHKKQTADKKPHPDAILFGDTILGQVESILQAVKSSPMLSGKYGDGSGDSEYSSISDIGVTFGSYDEKSKTVDMSGLLHINQEKLIDSVSNKDYQKLIKLFGRVTTLSNSHFVSFQMPTVLDPRIAGKAISVSYEYVGPSSTDPNYANNFSLTSLTAVINKELADKTISIAYSKNADSTFSASFYGISNQQTVTVNNIVNGIITLPTDSIFAGLEWNFTGEDPAVGTPTIASVTLPAYKATLSCPSQPDYTFICKSEKLIDPPKDSLYDGLAIGYDTIAPLVMGAPPVTTTLTLTQGIAISFEQSLKNAIAVHDQSGTPTSIFDLAVEDLLDKNKKDEKNITDLMDEAKFKREQLEPVVRKLYSQASNTTQVMMLIDIMTGNKKH